MARKPVIDMSAWPSLSLEGNLIAPAMVAQIAAPKDDEETRQSYRIRKGLTVREEISTAFRVGQSHFDTFRRMPNPSADATRRFMRDFLAEALGGVFIHASHAIVHARWTKAVNDVRVFSHRRAILRKRLIRLKKHSTR